MNNPRIERFKKMILTLDSGAVEGGRDELEETDIPQLEPFYWELKTWDEKECFIHLVCDTHHKALHNVMLDFLKSPITEGDGIAFAQASALCYMDKSFDKFNDYYDGVDLRKQKISKLHP